MVSDMTSSENIHERKIVSMSGLRWKMKSRSHYQIGETALIECSNILMNFLDDLIMEATRNLDDENERREREGVVARKTLQQIDFREAVKNIAEQGIILGREENR